MADRDLKPQRSKPWGSVAALAMACVATLIGVARGLDPDVVLLRAAGAAVMVAVGSSVAAATLRWLVQLR